MSSISSIYTGQNAVEILMNSGSNDLMTSIVNAHRTACSQNLSKYISAKTDDRDYQNVLSSVDTLSACIKKLQSTDGFSTQSTDASAADDSDTAAENTDHFITAYNTMMTNLTQVGGSLKTTFMAELTGIYEENKTALSEIGIQADENGLLTVDREVFNSADDAKKGALFGKTSPYLSGISSTIKSISEIVSKAMTISGALSSGYTNSGSESSSALSGGSFSSKA